MCRTIQNNLLTASQFPMGSFANFNTHISRQLCTFHHTYSYLVIFAPISHHSDLPKNKEISMVSNASTHNTASQAHNIKTKRRRTKLVFALGYGMDVYSLVSCHLLLSKQEILAKLYRVRADHLQVILRLYVDFCRVAVDFCSFQPPQSTQK